MVKKPIHPVARVLYLTVAYLALALGILGAFLPVLPTAPFVILAAFCFSKGSERMHQWMRDHILLGPPIRDWEDGGIIRLRAKWMATAMIVGSFAGLTLFSKLPVGAKAALDAVGLAVLVFIWSRPSAKVK